MMRGLLLLGRAMLALWHKLTGKVASLDTIAPTPATFTVYQAKDGYRWRLSGANNRIVADSGEAYTRLRDAERAARRVSAIACSAPIVRTTH